MYLTVRKLSDKLNVHRSTIYRWMKNYQIPYYKLSGRILFKESEIEDWVSSHSISSLEDELRVQLLRA